MCKKNQELEEFNNSLESKYLDNVDEYDDLKEKYDQLLEEYVETKVENKKESFED